jgi:uncharacterized protein
LPDRDQTQEEITVLELRPTCENCNKPLQPDATDARICTFECTFCEACVGGPLLGVCPNCGGGFVARPIRPAHTWKGWMPRDKYPASTTVKHKPVDVAEHQRLVAALKAAAAR